MADESNGGFLTNMLICSELFSRLCNHEHLKNKLKNRLFDLSTMKKNSELTVNISQ
jgi:hypothetical protein